jgi:hypothetical protein
MEGNGRWVRDKSKSRKTNEIGMAKDEEECASRQFVTNNVDGLENGMGQTGGTLSLTYVL